MKTETFTYIDGQITQQLSPWPFQAVFAGADPFQLRLPCWIEELERAA